MCLEIGNAETAQDIIYQQLKFIATQEKEGFSSSAIKIRCGCLKLVPWKYMHRCLYCSVFFCKECAEQHFGKTIEQYRAENPTHT